MLKTSRANGHPPTAEGAEEERNMGSHVVEDIEAAARRVASEDASGAALRSILIGAVLVGGLTFLARVLLRRQGKGEKRNRRR